MDSVSLLPKVTYRDCVLEGMVNVDRSIREEGGILWL